MPREFPDGSLLWLQPALSDADKTYIEREFWNQRWSRWDTLLRPFLPSALLPPLGLLLVLWAARAAVIVMRDRPG